MAEVLLLSILTLIASLVGTLSGFGTSTIMVPVLSLYWPLPITLLFVGIIHLCGDVWKMLLFRQGCDWKLILAFGIPGLLASYLGASLAFTLPQDLAQRLLGGFLFAYVTFIVLNRDWKLPAQTSTAAAGGALSGLFAGIFGVGGAIRGTFLSAFDPPKAVYIFTSGAIAFVIDTSRIAAYVQEGTVLNTSLGYGLVLYIPASFAGAYLAKNVLNQVPERSFRMLIGLFLVLVAGKLLLFPSV